MLPYYFGNATLPHGPTQIKRVLTLSYLLLLSNSTRSAGTTVSAATIQNTTPTAIIVPISAIVVSLPRERDLNPITAAIAVMHIG